MRKYWIGVVGMGRGNRNALGDGGSGLFMFRHLRLLGVRLEGWLSFGKLVLRYCEMAGNLWNKEG